MQFISSDMIHPSKSSGDNKKDCQPACQSPGGAVKRIRIKKDGHCQFRAVAVHTQGGQQWWKHVRERAAEWVHTHWLVVTEDMAQRGVTLRALLHRLQTDEETDK